MQFNSFAFLGFFGLVALAYYLVPHRFRWVLLLLVSYWFYSSFSAPHVLLLGLATLIAYGFGLLLARGRESGAKALLALAVVVQLSILAVYKYADFLIGTVEPVLGPILSAGEAFALPRMGWLLPVGLSFYTFSCVSYLVDVHRGTIAAERHLGKLAVYVAFFPKLIAGPIERAGPFLAQLARPVVFTPSLVVFGLQFLLWGLFKKVVIADRLAAFVDAAFTTPDFQSPVTLLVAVYFYAFQIYCDFSGYSDMAIGTAAVLGFRLVENFRRPYLARTVPEFWAKRWHISLMAWFRDYLYIPLGGSRVSIPRRYFNVMLVFMVSGLWHGAGLTFIVWGALNGLYQVVYLMTAAPRRMLARMMPKTLWSALSLLLTFNLIVVAWVFFRAASLDQALAVIGRIWDALPMLPGLLAAYVWTPSLLLSIGLIAVLMAIEVLDEFRPLWDWLAARPVVLRWGFSYALIGALLLIGQWGMTRFIYMQF